VGVLAGEDHRRPLRLLENGPVHGVEPTNNRAERLLRGRHPRQAPPPHPHRRRERFIERALSASVSCGLEGRPLFAYLAELVTAPAAATDSLRLPEHEG
jgi:hypothetical protein